MELAFNTIIERAFHTTEVTASEDARLKLEIRRDEWLRRIRNASAWRLGYKDESDSVVGLLQRPGEAWETFTCLTSLRDVEGTVDLLLDQNSHGLRNE
jgi:hypothetical protein